MKDHGKVDYIDGRLTIGGVACTLKAAAQAIGIVHSSMGERLHKYRAGLISKSDLLGPSQHRHRRGATPIGSVVFKGALIVAHNDGHLTYGGESISWENMAKIIGIGNNPMRRLMLKTIKDGKVSRLVEPQAPAEAGPTVEELISSAKKSLLCYPMHRFGEYFDERKSSRS